ncbi:hypothetical protein [Thiothrix subterranea]|uniref:hypothetical protein n=1 Tax=Thiothrix subterranea TaxID=2735563 RepID=UPI00280AA94C|nr:hypothetical protein [Thiothrix subterranea]
MAIFLACLLIAGGLGGILQYRLNRSFLDYLNEQENRSLTQLESRLVDVYEARGSWEELEQNPQLWTSILLSAVRSSFFPVNGDKFGAEPLPPCVNVTMNQAGCPRHGCILRNAWSALSGALCYWMPNAPW